MFELAVMQSEFKRLPAGRIAEQSDRRRPAAWPAAGILIHFSCDFIFYFPFLSLFQSVYPLFFFSSPAFCLSVSPALCHFQPATGTIRARMDRDNTLYEPSPDDAARRGGLACTAARHGSDVLIPLLPTGGGTASDLCC